MSSCNIEDVIAMKAEFVPKLSTEVDSIIVTKLDIIVKILAVCLLVKCALPILCRRVDRFAFTFSRTIFAVLRDARILTSNPELVLHL